MSKQQVGLFYKEVAEKPEIKAKLKEMKGDEASVHVQIAKIAKEYGFDATEADVKEFLAENETLDDDMLDRVAGGADDRCCAEVCGMFLGHYVGRQ